jgi:hypothetical protein
LGFRNTVGGTVPAALKRGPIVAGEGGLGDFLLLFFAPPIGPGPGVPAGGVGDILAARVGVISLATGMRDFCHEEKAFNQSWAAPVIWRVLAM